MIRARHFCTCHDELQNSTDMSKPIPDPLDQLHDIIQPVHAISAWPLAPGWWLLPGLLVLSVLLTIFLRPRLKERKRKRALRQSVSQMLDTLYAEYLSKNCTPSSLQNYLQHNNDLFKRTIHAHPGLSSYSSLTGKPWINVIAKVNPHECYPALYGEALYAAQCNENLDAEDLHRWAKQTLERMLDPDKALLKLVTDSAT
jgi:hypothetical protein